MRSWQARPVAIAIVVAACGGGDTSSPESVVRDSTGIRIVENAAPVWRSAERWLIREDPEVVIGGTDGTEQYELYEVAGALRFPDGRVLIANGGTHDLRLFDSNGRHLQTAGRQGSGPGEFEGIFNLARFRGDSIAVWDYRQTRLSVYDRDLKFARVIPATGLFTGSPPSLEGVLDDGSFIVRDGFNFAEIRLLAPGRHRLQTTYRRFAPDGEPLNEYGPLPAQEIRLDHPNEGGFRVSTNLPFVRRGLLSAQGANVRAADDDRPEIRGLDPDNHGTHPVGCRTKACRSDRARRITEDVAARLDDPDARVTWRRATERVPSPENMPVAEALHVDLDGNIWVREYTWPPGSVGRWQVFNEAGQWLGQVANPAGLQVLEIGADYVVGVARDELGVERVQVHRLVRAPRS